jgi:hypothetical protein
VLERVYRAVAWQRVDEIRYNTHVPVKKLLYLQPNANSGKYTSNTTTE